MVDKQTVSNDELLPSKQRVARSSRAGTTTTSSIKSIVRQRLDAIKRGEPLPSDKFCPDPVQAATHRVLIIRGGSVLVSIEDYERVAAFHWSVKRDKWGCHYARAHVPGSGKRGKSILMHRFILGAKKGEIVDHRDGWGLNNSRENLRLCTNAENIRNQKVHQTRKTHSKLKGVYRLGNGRWRAQIMVQYKKKNLGTFPDEIAAAQAYDAAAIKLHGDFARLNFPDGAAACSERTFTALSQFQEERA